MALMPLHHKGDLRSQHANAPGFLFRTKDVRCSTRIDCFA
jgi:hypothetical protein